MISRRSVLAFLGLAPAAVVAAKAAPAPVSLRGDMHLDGTINGCTGGFVFDGTRVEFRDPIHELSIGHKDGAPFVVYGRFRMPDGTIIERKPGEAAYRLYPDPASDPT